MAEHTKSAFFPFLLETSWQEALKEELSKPYLVHLAAFLESEERLHKVIYPPKELIFNAFQFTPFNQVQVVLIGQDPYHGPGQAHGLSFSVPKGVKPPPSLQNIFKELREDLVPDRRNFHYSADVKALPLPAHGCLSGWAKQGVLMLNATLTVAAREPLSHHGRGWETFTDAVVRILADRQDPIIFVLWGKSAQEKCRYLSGGRHLVIKAAHPSPYSANQGFFGTRPFSKINALLAQQNKPPIDWSIY